MQKADVVRVHPPTDTSKLNVDGLARPGTFSTMASFPKTVETDSELKSSDEDSSKDERVVGPPSLFHAMAKGKVGVFLQFGGQGLYQGTHYLDELAHLYHGGNALIETCVARLQKEVSSPKLQHFGLHKHGLDVIEWITNSASRPPAAYLKSAPVSYALIGLTQLAQYAHMVLNSGYNFAEFVSHIKGATGHSQGIMGAVVAGTSATKEAFDVNVEKAVVYLLWHGSRLQVLVNSALPPGELDHCMMSVSGLSRSALADLVEKKMKKAQMAISLENGVHKFVVSGTSQALGELKMVLTRMSADSQQERVAFSKRKPVITTRFIESSVPFHHPMLQPATMAILKDVQYLKYTIPPSAFLFPVYGNNQKAENFQGAKEDVFPNVVAMQVHEAVVWKSALRAATNERGVTHILDLGPGGSSGAGVFSQRLLEGTGVQIINISDRTECDQLFLEKERVTFARNWQQYCPKVVTREGKRMMSTKWTNLIGKPPIMVAGMTPTTSCYGLDLVAAASNGGFQCELAAGGMSRPEIFTERIETLCEKLNPGVGVVINMLYLNARQFGFQLPLAVSMRKNGFPIESITIGAGVPSLEKGNEIVKQLKECGIRYMTLKPGSTSAIESALEIANANPDFYIVLQWTGGRGGGHHSFEDMHAPILQTYARIRALDNTLLVAGSGFGDSEGTLPYLTGTWSTTFGYPPMPYDSILLASRVMVCAEATTATRVKELLVRTVGVTEEAKWESSYDGEAGGVITVKSELGEPIHKIATRGMRLWREFDKLFFGLPLKDRAVQVAKKKEYIIQRLNADFQKVYFGRKASGEVCDVADMTYAEVLTRFVQLCFIRPEDEVEAKRHENYMPHGRWIDISYRSRLESWIQRCEAHVNVGNASFLASNPDLSRPMEVVNAFLAAFPSLQELLLTAEDVDVFLHMCKSGKPAPFVPVIDGELEMWFKKDSLWYSEDLAAVPEQDVDRVCILQGPVSVPYSTTVNEPVGAVLENICDGWVSAVAESEIEEEPEPDIDFSVFPSVLANGDDITICLPTSSADLPEEGQWLRFLGGRKDSWLKALMTSPTLVSGKKWRPNVLRHLFRPQPSQKVEIFFSPLDTQHTLRVFDAKDGYKQAVLEAALEQDVITVTINDVRPATLNAPLEVVPFRLYATYHALLPYAQLHEKVDKVDEVKNYYRKLWFADDDVVEDDIQAMHCTEFSITQRDVEEFNAAIHARPSDDCTTIDFCIVAAWKSLIACLFPKALRGNILDLVHLNNGYTVIDKKPLRVGDRIQSAMRVVEIVNIAAGKVVKCAGTLTREGNPIVELSSSFLFRGTFTDSHNSFKRYHRVATIGVENDEALLAVLQSKEWFHPVEKIVKGDRLEFSVTVNDTYTSDSMNCEVHGVVRRASREIGTIQWIGEDVAGNVVAAFLDRWEVLSEKPAVLDHGGYTMLSQVDVTTAPLSNLAYAVASRDLNPIHRNTYLSQIAGLSSPIVHGMWTSSNARRVVELAAGSAKNITAFSCEFEAMVSAGEKLYTQITHVANKNGRKVATVKSCNGEGAVVLKGRAEIDFPVTACVFTGQGSQEKGMGMDLYARSKHARAVWDEAEAHLMETFGFSILDIVRNNPVSKTIHFGGRKGAALRKTYLALKTLRPDGTSEPLIPAITPHSTSYTFEAPNGLLFATQFTQPALTLMEVAVFQDLNAHGVIPPDHVLAGHSLGEYAALMATPNFLSIKMVVEIVFLRGMTMQQAVPRDAQGKSEYGMISVNPMRVGSHMTEQYLKEVVDLVEQRTNRLLQIVNYNVLGMQYIVAGHTYALVVLDDVMTALMQTDKALDDIVAASIATVEDRVAPLTLERGKTTIPLAGIDVPFHSRFLLPGVDSFRKTLDERVCPADPKYLVGRYVPNLTAQVFQLSKDYFQNVHDVTQSPVIGEILMDWERRSADQAAIGRLLLIELLAYQFASPVQWIRTQEYFFTSGRVRRVLEIGPTPVLKAMALRTLATGGYGSPGSRSVLHALQDHDEAYCRVENRGPACEEAINAEVKETEEPVTPAPAIAPVALAIAPVAPVAPQARPAVPECPITALEVLQVTLALKLRKTLEEVPESSTIKELSGGKSALQNEIMGDLAQEFGDSAPEGALELSLSDLAKVFTSYNCMGKFTNECLNKLITAKMPGGFGLSSLKKYLTDDYNLGPGRLDGVLVHMLVMSPAERLASEGEALQWIDSAVEAYGKKMGVSIGKGAAGADGGMLATLMAMMGGASPQPIADAPVTAKEVIRVIVSFKLKLALSAVTDDKNLKDLTGGKSALQNEILGDLSAELGELNEDATNVSIGDLSLQFPNYSTLGKTTNALISRLFSSKMKHFPMSAVTTHLTKQRLLPPGRVDSVLLHAVTMEPASILPDTSSCEKWLDSVVDSFGALNNLVIPRAGSGGAVSLEGLGGSAKAVDALEKRFNNLLETTIDHQMEFLQHDKFSDARDYQAEMLVRTAVEKELALWLSEHGDFYAAGIKPLFSAAKERRYDSYWNWSRTDVLTLYNTWSGKESHETMRHIANRGTNELLDLINELDPQEQFLDLITSNMKNPSCGVFFQSLAPKTCIFEDGRIEYEEVPRPGTESVEDFIAEMKRGVEYRPSVEYARKSHRTMAVTSHIYMETCNPERPTIRVVDDEASEEYFTAMRDLAHQGVSLVGKVALITGCGVGSIGISLVKYLLQAGAHVIATTSSFTLERTYFYRAIYEENCAASAVLTLLPFNQASAQDITSLVSHIYDRMGVDIDFVVPFAAISENGSDISSIEGRNELSHRIMLTNTIRLLGAIKAVKEARKIVTNPAVAFLPLSPNHGIFGNDGLYAESKLGLESMLAKSVTEGWSDYMSVVGVVIGWTRGTGLMSGNNMVAESLESAGLRTFSMAEMAFCLMALFHPTMVSLSHEFPIVANLGGGINLVSNLKEVSMATRADVFARAAIKRRVKSDTVADDKVMSGQATRETSAVKQVSHFKGTEFPSLPTPQRVGTLSNALQDMVDLEKMVVCVGYGEVGPFASARTRWEMESYGHLSLEGSVELAWILGYIRYHNGPLAGRDHYIGWVDAVSSEPVSHLDVKSRYEETMLSLCGVRVIDQKMFGGYDPHNKQYFHQMVLDRNMRPLEVASKSEAEELRRRVGASQSDIFQRDDGAWCVQFKRGTTILLPRALQFDRFYAAQVPTGWDAVRLGIPKDLAERFDPVVMYTLVSTVEALLAAGITDPYEFYQYVHISEVGNTSGGGLGGMHSLNMVFQKRFINRDNNPVAADVLQETFINTAFAWVNMLLLSSTGPIRTPVGACATAAESVDIGVDTIVNGKAAVVIVGACDDISEESVFEFASMQATSNSVTELAMGRDPREMSRPCTTTRGGFMESHGAGNQILTTAKLALQMGLPIYAIVAHTATATDCEGRSVPAPGQGIMTTAREAASAIPSPMLDLSYRRRRLRDALATVDSSLEHEIQCAHAEAQDLREDERAAFVASRTEFASREVERRRQNALSLWGNNFYQDDPTIAPLRGALAVYGLTIDDIAMASFHGTGTKLNDKNESSVTHAQMEHLGRRKGNPLYVVAQKSLTGHPKGPAAAWMFNGCIQAMQHNIVPGNRNLDNVASELREYSHLVYPSKTVELREPMKACMLKSFGFGQVNSEILLIHPDYVFGVCGEDIFALYAERRARRERQAFQYMQNALAGKHSLVQVKTFAPYSSEMQNEVYLNPVLRASYDAELRTYTFSEAERRKLGNRVSEKSREVTIAPQYRPAPAVEIPAAKKLEIAMTQAAEGLRHKQDKGIGLDIEAIATFVDKDDVFLRRNFTDSELEHCSKSVNTAASLAARWAAKEATIKAISSSSPDGQKLWKSSGSPLRDIEVVMSPSGAPTIKLHNYARDVAHAHGISEVKISISHASDVAVCQAVAS